MFHGKGGFDYHTVYNMPIWLRNFTFNQISKFYEEQQKANKKGKKKLDDLPSGPAIRKPDYTTKARK